MDIRVFQDGEYIGLAESIMTSVNREDEYTAPEQSIDLINFSAVGEKKRKYGIRDSKGNTYWCKNLTEGETIMKFLETCEPPEGEYYELFSTPEVQEKVIRTTKGSSE